MFSLSGFSSIALTMLTLEYLSCVIKLKVNYDPWSGSWVRGAFGGKLYWLCQRLWLCGSQQTVENSERDGNTRSPEKSVSRLRSNSLNWTWNNRLVPNQERSTSRLLLPCLFNLYAEYIMRNAGLEETQTGIKIAGRNINNLRYADDTTLMAQSEEELKSLLMKVKWRVKKLA